MLSGAQVNYNLLRGINDVFLYTCSHREMENNNRSVCPLISWAARELHWKRQRVYSNSCAERLRVIFEFLSPLGLSFVILVHERGIPCKCESLACVECVPAPCTHRLSLLPMKCLARTMDGWWYACISVLEITWLKVVQACHFRGSKSRNKVSVGEPAEGSIHITLLLLNSITISTYTKQTETVFVRKNWIS